MRYHDLHIQTQREFPNNARVDGFGWLVRAGYMTRDNEILPLGRKTLARLQESSKSSSPLPFPSLSTIASDDETYIPISSGSTTVMHCPVCKYTARQELAEFTKSHPPPEELRPLERVSTPDCNTIELLANFLDIPKEKTAKAMMFTRVADRKFVFVVIRGDMTLSKAKLRKAIGEVKLATAEEIRKNGAEAGYASPVGLTDALIVVDDIVPKSPNLVAGSNEAGYHLLNTNYERDYKAEIVEDLVQAKSGDVCAHCHQPLEALNCEILATHKNGGTSFLYHDHNLLLALAETHHDERGLTFPATVAPFAVYLMHIPGKELDTRARADEIYNQCEEAGISVLFDDRDERAGVKFNDADLIGCPIRLTIGERGIKDGATEVKVRKTGESVNIKMDALISHIKNFLLP